MIVDIVHPISNIAIAMTNGITPELNLPTQQPIMAVPTTTVTNMGLGNLFNNPYTSLHSTVNQLDLWNLNVTDYQSLFRQ